MNPPSAQPSSRFSRAARAERDRLLRRREAAQTQIDALRASLDAGERALHELEQQISRLESMSGIEAEAKGRAHTGAATSEPTADSGGDARLTGSQASGKLISGADIRTVAVEVYLRSPFTGQALHYRRWLELVEDAGYRIQGKRPEAVFLGQLTRSPVVRSAGETGHYDVDAQAIERLAAERRRVEHELLHSAQPVSAEPEAIRAAGERQAELMADLRRIQRDIEEASQVLGYSEGARALAA